MVAYGVRVGSGEARSAYSTCTTASCGCGGSETAGAECRSPPVKNGYAILHLACRTVLLSAVARMGFYSCQMPAPHPTPPTTNQTPDLGPVPEHDFDSDPGVGVLELALHDETCMHKIHYILYLVSGVRGSKGEAGEPQINGWHKWHLPEAR